MAKIALVADQMLPIAALPDTALTAPAADRGKAWRQAGAIRERLIAPYDHTVGCDGAQRNRTGSEGGVAQPNGAIREGLIAPYNLT